MFFWFLGLSFLAVLVVFSSPALDYRLVMFGAVLPVVEVAVGGAWVLHTLLAPVAVLTVVMLATTGRRLPRRQWLGLPIGMFMHLVLDGSWTTSELFWWPVLGGEGVLGEVDVPEAGRNVVVVAAMEVVGVAVLAFLVQRLDLAGAGRERFVRTGQLMRDRLV